MTTADILAAARANKPGAAPNAAAADTAPAETVDEAPAPTAETGTNGTSTNGDAAEHAAEPVPANEAASEISAASERRSEGTTASAVQIKAGAVPQTIEEKIAYCRQVDSK